MMEKAKRRQVVVGGGWMGMTQRTKVMKCSGEMRIERGREKELLWKVETVIERQRP